MLALNAVNDRFEHFIHLHVLFFRIIWFRHQISDWVTYCVKISEKWHTLANLFPCIINRISNKSILWKSSISLYLVLSAHGAEFSSIYFITGCTRCLPGAVPWEGTGQEDPDSTEDDSGMALPSTLPEDEGQLYHNANNMEGIHRQKEIPYGTDIKTTKWLLNTVDS